MNSKHPYAQKMAPVVDRLEVEVTTTSAYQYFYLGAHSDNTGAGGLYSILISNNTADIDFVVEEGINENGPFSQIATGTIGAPVVGVAQKNTGIMYSPIIRVGLKYTGGAGTVLLQMASH